MRVAITGASGLVGQHTAAIMRADGHEVRAVSTRGVLRPDEFEGCDAVVHLAGEPVAQRWTEKARERIRSSRVEGTRRVVEVLGKLKTPPSVLVSASAIGIYGSRGEEVLTESSAPANDFLGEISVEWEREARAAEAFGMRAVMLRFAVILAREGGALKKMLLPFKLGVGGRIGDGQQWMSWIHIDDVVRMIAFALANPLLSGPVNASAPNPVRNGEFTRDLAAALHRPAIFPVPIFALRLLFGQMAEIVYGRQRVMPEAALRAGFEFKFPELGTALQNILAANERE
jgi:uncharacterized protein